MSSSSDCVERKRPLRTVVSVALFSIPALVWFFGIGDHTPSRQDAEHFLDWGLDDGDGIVGFRSNGAMQRLKTATITGIESVECHRNWPERGWFQKRSHGLPRYDCIYRLAGSTDEQYYTVVGATYFSRDDYKLAHVGNYMLSFWAEPDQRRMLAEHGISLPEP
jgi:hypothetical protein